LWSRQANGHDCWPKDDRRQGLACHGADQVRDDMGYRARVYARQCRSPRRDDAGRYITSAVVDRAGKLFIDYLRNGRGTTAIGAYSPRARPGFPIAAPVTWREIRARAAIGHFQHSSPAAARGQRDRVTP
jgi:bifunctional non-homologous end joining protein LigD